MKKVVDIEMRYVMSDGATQWTIRRMEISPGMTLRDVAAVFVVPQLAIALNALDVPFRED
jgi:hypothetical protein